MQLDESFDNVPKVISISGDDDDYLYHSKTKFVAMNNGQPLHVGWM